MLLAARGGHGRSLRAVLELVHVRHVGVATGGPDDPRRGPPRGAPARARPRRRAAASGRRRSGGRSSAAASSSATPGSAGWRRSCTRRSTRSSWRATPSPAATARSSPRSGSSSRDTWRSAGPTSAGLRRVPALPRRACDPGRRPTGSRYLRQAFTRYQRQRFEPDPKRRAELTALANLEIGLHEQTRLQPEIRAALDVAGSTEDELGGRLLCAVWPRLSRRRRRPASRPPRIDRARRRGLRGGPRRAEPHGDHALPDGARAARLGARPRPQPRDAVRGAAADAGRPGARRAGRALRAGTARADDCGARDWSELAQRMHYISHLFRSTTTTPSWPTRRSRPSRSSASGREGPGRRPLRRPGTPGSAPVVPRWRLLKPDSGGLRQRAPLVSVCAIPDKSVRDRRACRARRAAAPQGSR